MIEDGTAGPNLYRPTAPAIRNPQPSREPFGERAFGLEANRQAALAGGTLPPPPLPPCTRPGCCAPGTPEQVNAVHAARKVAQGKRDAASSAVERGDVVTELGQYLFDQMKAYPQLADWIAGDLIAHLVRVGKKPDMPGAVRVLIDVTSDVEALVTLTPADPPSPPAPTPRAAMSRRRWWSTHRANAGRLALVLGSSYGAYLWIQLVQQ